MNVPITLLLLLALLLAGCGSASPRATVTLGIYSGLPDPSWSLTRSQALTLAGMLDRLEPVEGQLPEGGLGYRGFAVELAGSDVGEAVRADAGLVEVTGPGGTRLYQDPERGVERWLLETGRSILSPEIVREIERALQGPAP